MRVELLETRNLQKRKINGNKEKIELRKRHAIKKVKMEMWQKLNKKVKVELRKKNAIKKVKMQIFRKGNKESESANFQKIN